jgi:hypothetical protein
VGTLLVVLWADHSSSLSLPSQLSLPVPLLQLLTLLWLLLVLLLLYVLYLELKPIEPAQPLSSQSGQIQETNVGGLKDFAQGRQKWEQQSLH